MKPGSHGESSAKNKLDSLFFARLFVSEQKQIALIADENLRFSSYLRNKLLRNEDFMKNDMKLVRRAKRGDVDAFAELYAGIYKDMYRFALYTLRNTSDAEDAVSDAVTDAFASIRKLRSEEAFKSWIFRILSNKCKDKLREYAGKNETGMEGTTYGQDGYGIPVLTYEELTALVLGYDPWEIGLQMHQVSVEPLLDKMGIPYDPEAKFKNIRGEDIGAPKCPTYLRVSKL